MFLTENVNYQDSILFLLSARMALKEIVKLSSVEEKESLNEFIIKEASDYQVISLLVNGELPEEKYNIIEESVLYSKLKEQLILNYNSISEVVEPKLINNIIFEVDSIYPNYSTSASIMEFISSVQEAGPKFRSPISTTMEQLEKAEAPSWWKHDINKGKDTTFVLKKWAKKNPDKTKKIGAGILAAIAIYAGYKIYKRFLSKAAKSCKDLSGAEKTTCINKFKKQALEGQEKELKKGLSACSKSSNPAKCKVIVNNRISKIKAKQAKLV